MRTLPVALLALAALFAGCAQSSTTSSDGGAVGGNLPLGHNLTVGPGEGPPLLAGPQLWKDPQNMPHPKWNWPTLSNPPAGPNVPTWWVPFNATELPAHISGLKHVARAGGNVTQGAGIALFGSLAVVPEDSQFAHIVSIADPVHPSQLSQIDSSGRGAAIIAYPNGRLVTAIATSPGFDTIDITDPTQPEMLNQTAIPVQGGHKLGVVPGTPILYNAGSSGGGAGGSARPGPCNVSVTMCVGYTEIYDLTDPENPRFVENFQNGVSCHHIFFWNALDGSKQRAICAGMQYTQIWDTADPLKPTVVVSLPVHLGVSGTPSAMVEIEDFSHSAGINLKGNILYVGDENCGGSSATCYVGGPGSACGVSTATVGGQAGAPLGATWFYDISDETNPAPLGYFAPPRDATHEPSRSCTTHHGRIVPDKEGRDLLAMSFYQDGAILIDFTDIGAGKLPTAIAEFNDGSDTWETWYAGGYLFLGDLNNGLDVVGFT